MAKVIILFFLSTGGFMYYATYNGINQEMIETTTKESIRSNAYHSSTRSSSYGSTGSYNSSSYGYGK